jgi:hypothetical protein
MKKLNFYLCIRKSYDNIISFSAPNFLSCSEAHIFASQTPKILKNLKYVDFFMVKITDSRKIDTFQTIFVVYTKQKNSIQRLPDSVLHLIITRHGWDASSVIKGLAFTKSLKLNSHMTV